MLAKSIPLGIYEKALPPGSAGWSGCSWRRRWVLILWKCLSMKRTFALRDWTGAPSSVWRWSRRWLTPASGYHRCALAPIAVFRWVVKTTRCVIRGLEIMRKAIQLAQDVGIRVIQLAGYDVYYQQANDETRRRFRDGLKQSVEMASRAQVTLAMEIMDYPLMNSISKALGYAHYLNNPWFQLYPDIGNLSAWDNDVQMELKAGSGHIVAVHVKDTKPGVFKNVPFGEGVVDFERCFETLKQTGYCGPYLIEMWSETSADPLAEVAKARDWVKARMARAGLMEAA